jgi:hypothetical protein
MLTVMVIVNHEYCVPPNRQSNFPDATLVMNIPEFNAACLRWNINFEHYLNFALRSMGVSNPSTPLASVIEAPL